jgi:hypothetical protein
MGDNSDNDISRIIELIRKIEADAFRRGQDHAAAHILAAAQGAMHVTPEMTVAVETAGPSTNGTVRAPKRLPGGQPGAKRATRGSVRQYVHRVLSDPHYQGADYDGIIDRVKALGGTEIAPASIRNYLRSAAKTTREVRRQNDLWFLSQPPWGREGENRAVDQPGESQNRFDDGGSRVANGDEKMM